MQFKVGDYKDSNIRMLTGTIKADWLPVERYLAALPTLKQGQRCSRSRVHALPTVWPNVSMLGASNVGQYPPTMDYYSGIWKPKGLVGTRWQKEKSGSLPTGLIGLEMI